MFIEHVDLLRCPRDHEDSWLVLAIHEKVDRDIVRGLLGCPICEAEYPIRGGEAIFDAMSVPGHAAQRDRYDESDDDLAMRCAAMLDLFDPGGAVLLGGTWARVGPALLDIAPVAILFLDPPEGFVAHAGVSVIRAGASLPLASGSLRGVALDTATASPTLVEAGARVLKARGRLVAPVSSSTPAGVVERARDDEYWVAERDATVTAPIQLVRSSTTSEG
jgi:uncharacterized protein YbaR (Trm112 family)